MSKEELWQAIRAIAVVVTVVVIVVSIVCVVGEGIAEGRVEACARLGERLGYETELISGRCYIQVRPGLKVREDLVLEFLSVIDCR